MMAGSATLHYPQSMNLHATCVAIEGYGILLRGPSGSGKSDLALRLIDQYADAILVADDRVDVAAREGAVYASAPSVIAGMLEVRGVGIARVAYKDVIRLHLLVDLMDGAEIPRLPEAQYEEILGVRLPRLPLAPFEASAAAKLRQALRQIYGPETKP